MAELTNFTQDNSQKTISELRCKAEFTGKVHSELIFLSVLNTFLSITAFLENTLILVALHRDTSLHPPSKLLFRNLAITDLFVGITAEPLYVVYWMSEVRERWVQVTLVVCYLPAAIVVALTPQRGISTSTYLNKQFTISLVFLNSSLNPLLYCWKIREVRQAVKETLRGLRCSSN